MPFRETVTVYS